MEPEPPHCDLVPVDPVRPSADRLAELGARLRDGALVAFPTETVYGLGAAIDRPDALRRIFEVKGRPPTDPLIVHLADPGDLAAGALELAAGALDGAASDDRTGGLVAEVAPAAMALADAFWPGPLTIVVRRGRRIDDVISAGGPSVGLRVPAHPVAAGLIRAAGCPLAAPSANRFGRISPTSAADVMDELGAWMRPLDAVVDGGPTPLGIESTVIDLTGDPTVLRHGGVTVEDIESVIGHVDAPERRVVADDQAASAPGGLLRHYSPDTPLVLVEGDGRLADELAAELRRRGVTAQALGLPVDAAAAAQVLYRTLREADGGHAQVLLAVVVAPGGLGRGVNDRLFRAAHGRVVDDATLATVDRVAALARR
jgi:L-threonylcarbamoyladenylate synthase